MLKEWQCGIETVSLVLVHVMDHAQRCFLLNLLNGHLYYAVSCLIPRVAAE